MSSTPSFWLRSLALAAIVMTVSVHEAAAQRTQPAPESAQRPPTATSQPANRPTTAPAPTRTTPGAPTGPAGLPGDIAAAPIAAKVYALPQISYGEPMPPPTTSKAFDARLARFETVNVAARVNGASVTRPLVVLNGRDGIENAPGIPDGARRLLGMHVRKLNLSESTVYFFDPAVAQAWLATHEVPPGIEPQDEESNDNDDSGCGFQNLGNCASDPVGAVQDAGEAIEEEFERARDQAEDLWNDSAEDLADLWDEAQNCFSDHVLPGGTVPVRFDIEPAMAVNLSQSGSRGAASGNVTGSVGLGIPMDGDLQAKVDFFYIPCLPFVVRPRSITVTGDLTVGEVIGIQATATGEFNSRYTIPPTGGPRIPIQVIPIIIGGVPVAIIDVSAYIEGEIEVTADGSVVGTATLSNEHKTTLDFTCDGHGCKTGPRGQPTASTPITTTQAVQIEGTVTAKPAIYTALMLTLNVNVLGARLGPQPFLEGTAVGCGAATATQTNGTQTAGDQNAALAADLDWGVDFRAEALVGGKVLPNDWRRTITEGNHIWFRDLIPGGSSALLAAIAGPAEAATGQATAYKLSVPSCYPYREDTKYRVTWTGDATPSVTPGSACQWQAGRGDCRFDPALGLDVRFAWPTAGNYSLTAALIGDEHRTFDPAPLATELAVAVTGEATTTGAGGGGGSTSSTGSTPDRGQRGDASTGPSVDRGSGSGCCDIVPNPDMRGRLGRVVVAYPEEVAARIEVFRTGETQSLAAGYGDAAFDLFPGTYDVMISGKRVTGVTVRSGNDTKIKVGVLRVTASDGTRVDLVDRADGKSLTSGYGTDAYGLPIGEVGVRIAGQTEAVVIEPGQVTDF
jgi:hypothetical protein